MTFFTKDTFRAAIEAASGGKRTVLYDDLGQPSVMNIIPRFNLEDIDPELGTGIHPAFSVGGVEKSEIFVASFPGVLANERICSMPLTKPTAALTFDQGKNYCKAKGPGWHMLTNAEWAAIALWCVKNDLIPRGNTNYGRSHEALYETGRREDGAAPGYTGGSPYTIPGSGPSTWNHDLTDSGIVDLVGNRRAWVDLIKIEDGRIYCPSDNNYLLEDDQQWPAQDYYYDSVNPGTDDGTTQSLSGIILSDGVVNQTNPGASEDYATNTFKTLGKKEGLTVPSLLKSLLLAPGESEVLQKVNGALYMRNVGSRFGLRGGYYRNGSGAGLGCLFLYSERSNVYSINEVRCAFTN